MVFKPLGVDENNHLPDRVENRLKNDFAPLDTFGVPTTKSGLRVATDAPVDIRMAYSGATPSDMSAAFSSAINEANATASQGWVRPIYLPEGIWDVKTTINVTNQSVVITGPGIVRIGQNSGFLSIQQTQASGVSGTIGTLRAVVSANSTSDINYGAESIFTFANPANIVGLQNGDIVYLDSDTTYTPTWVSNSSSKTYKGQWFPVYGIGLSVSLNSSGGGVPQGAVVVGATSNAKGVVLGSRARLGSTSTDYALTFSKVVDATTGTPSTFVNGESLSVKYETSTEDNVATVSNVPYIISSVRMIDAHETDAQIHKTHVPDMVVDLDIRVITDGDSDAVITAAERKPAVQLTGLLNSKVKIHVKDAWTRAVRWQGCWMPQGEGYAVKMPNNADLTEQAYGYLFEVFGSTEFGKFTLQARNTRHAFTTNTISSSSRLTSQFSRTGSPKWNTVYDSVVTGNIDAAFDTHGGCYRTEFINCRAIGVSGGRATTRGAAFQARGAGVRFINCSAEKVPTGWRIASNTFDYDWDNEIELVGCVVLGYGVTGYEIGSTTVPSTLQKRTTLSLRNCRAVANGEDAATSGNTQAGYLIHSGQTVKIIGCEEERSNWAPLLVTGFAPNAVGRLVITNFTVDYDNGLTTAAPIHFNGAPTLPVIVDNLTALTSSATSNVPPTSWFRVSGITGTNALKLRVGRFLSPYRTNNTTTFQYASGSSSANVEYLGIREGGSRMYGAASATIESLAPGASTVKTVSVPGAVPSDVAQASFNVSVPAGVIMETPYVTADSVGIRFTNVLTTASVASSAGNLQVFVTKKGGS